MEKKKSIDDFNRYNQDLYNSAWKSQFLSGLMMPLTTFIGNLGYVGVCILGGALAISGEIAVGDIQSFITYTGKLHTTNQRICRINEYVTKYGCSCRTSFRIFK